MRSRTHRPWKAAGLAALVLLLPLGAPPAAGAAKVVSAKAVINSCGADQLAITARAKPKKRVRGQRTRRRLRRFRRKIRGSKLEVQFRAIALFGGERRSPWIKADRGGRASHAFARLPADSWTGFVRFRWRRGGRTRGSSFVNSSNGSVGGRRGRSLCSLGVGIPPRDATPPFVTIFPGDSKWRRPFTAQLAAKDDFSGVAATEFRINGGSLRRGPKIALGSQGVQRVDYRARDAAGNNSAFKRAVLRVDTGPPTRPVVDAAPFDPSGDVTPTIRWRKATDSGSGVKRYSVEARNSAGRVVAARSVAATGAARQAVTLPALHSGFAFRAYTIRVHAFDGVEFKSVSSSRTFRIDTRPLYSNSFETTAQCDGFVLSPATDNPFTCANARTTDSVFPGREIGTSTATRPDPPDVFPATGTATATRSFSASAGQRIGVSLARLISLERDADDASVEVRIDGGPPLISVTEESALASAARRVSAVWEAPTSGIHTLEIELSVTIVNAGSPVNANARVFADEIFAFLID